MVRLSIIDVEHGWQPLWNEKEDIGVVANSEIYNYLELTKELELKNPLIKIRLT
jgi:asparagine synthase (glutamine-hydrolysing)